MADKEETLEYEKELEYEKFEVTTGGTTKDKPRGETTPSADATPSSGASSGGEASTLEGSSSAPSSPPPPPPHSSSPTPPPPPSGPSGMSYAYAEVPECDIYGNPIKKEAPKQDEKEYPKPPKRGDGGKSGGESNIMELFWKEFILASYDWVINTSVDTVLDFTDYILYRRNEKNEEPKKEKLDILSIGARIRQKTKEKMLKRKEIANLGYQEIANNLEKSKQGQKVEWKVLQKEPKAFRELSKIYKKDEKDRTRAEKEYMKSFKEAQKVLNQMIDEAIRLREIAITGATFESVCNHMDGYAVSKDFSENFEKLEKAVKNKNTADVNSTILVLEQELVPETKPMAEEVKEALLFIKEAANTNNYSRATDLTKDIKTKISKEFENPEFWEKTIKAKEEAYFEEFKLERENINNEDKRTISIDFDDNLSLLGEHISHTFAQDAENKVIVNSLLATMSDMLNPDVAEEKELQAELLKIRETAEESKDSQVAVAILHQVEHFSNRYEALNTNKTPPLGTENFIKYKESLEKSLENILNTQAENKNIALSFMTQMLGDTSIDDTNPSHEELKKDLNTIYDTTAISTPQEFASVINEPLNEFLQKNERFNPKVEAKVKYYNSLKKVIVDLDKATKEYSQGIKSLFNGDEKKRKMHESVKTLQQTFRDHPTPEPSSVSVNLMSSQAISLDIMNNIKER